MTTPPPRAVSVIIPVFNRREMVVESIESVIAQEGFDLQILVVDDGSTDGSAEAVKALAAKGYPITLRTHPNNRGVSAARNTALALATKPLVGFLDSDDLLQPGAYESLWRVLADNAGCDITHGLRLDIPLGVATEPAFAHARSISTDVMFLSGTLMRSSVVATAGDFDESLRSEEDLAWFAGIPEVMNRLHVWPEVTLHRRIAGDNLTSDVAALRRNRLAWVRARLNQNDPT